MDSESDSITSDDGGGKKEEMKKSIFVKRKSNESHEENAKSIMTKNPFSLPQAKKVQINGVVQKKKKTENENLNNAKPAVVSSMDDR